MRQTFEFIRETVARFKRDQDDIDLPVQGEFRALSQDLLQLLLPTSGTRKSPQREAKQDKSSYQKPSRGEKVYLWDSSSSISEESTASVMR